MSSAKGEEDTDGTVENETDYSKTTNLLRGCGGKFDALGLLVYFVDGILVLLIYVQSSHWKGRDHA